MRNGGWLLFHAPQAGIPFPRPQFLRLCRCVFTCGLFFLPDELLPSPLFCVTNAEISLALCDTHANRSGNDRGGAAGRDLSLTKTQRGKAQCKPLRAKHPPFFSGSEFYRTVWPAQADGPLHGRTARLPPRDQIDKKHNASRYFMP